MTQNEAQKNTSRKPRFIDPPNILRQKCGKGGIEPLRLERADEFIDNNPLDFSPYALEIMGRLAAIIKQAKSGKLKGKEALDMLTRPIMELKANGGMFKYMLVSHIADIVLNFLETIDELNADVFEIIDAHQNALSVIIANKLQGSGGKEGKALADELDNACKRYYKKHGFAGRG